MWRDVAEGYRGWSEELLQVCQSYGHLREAVEGIVQRVGLHVKVVARVLRLRERIAGPAMLGQEGVVVVLGGILFSGWTYWHPAGTEPATGSTSQLAVLAQHFSHA
eukprot:799395-Prorocentrum_minimum.AAC.5